MATLTHSMLEDLHRGNAAISLLSVPSGGQVTFSSLDFSAADQIYTLKDSFQISQDDPSNEEIKVDQNDETIDTDTTLGEMTLVGKIPSIAAALLEYFYNKGASVTSVSGQGGGKTYSGAGFFKNPKEVIATVLVESASKKTAICFARVKMTVSLSQDDSSSPLGLSFNGTVLGNLKDGQGDFAVLKSA